MGKEIKFFVNTSLGDPQKKDSIYAPVLKDIKDLRTASGDSFFPFYIRNRNAEDYLEQLEKNITSSEFYLLIIDQSINNTTEELIKDIETEYDLAKNKDKKLLIFLHKDIDLDNNELESGYLKEFFYKINEPQNIIRWKNKCKLKKLVRNNLLGEPNSFLGKVNAWKKKIPPVKWLEAFVNFSMALMGMNLVLKLPSCNLWTPTEPSNEMTKTAAFNLTASAVNPATETLETITVTPEPPTPTHPTPTYTPIPATPPTTPPTITLTPTITPYASLGNIKVGVIAHGDDCGEDFNKNEEIIAGLQQIGFTATEVAYNSADDFSGFNVLYVPYGWGCSNKYFDDDDVDLFNKIYSFLAIPEKGLLIGDPKIKPPITPTEISIDFLGAVPFKFSHIDSQKVAKQTLTPNPLLTPTVDSANCLGVFEGFEPLPRAESELFAPCKNPPGNAKFARERETCRRVIIYNYSGDTEEHISVLCSWESVDNDVLRFIVMPGSEYGVSDHQISATLMKRIILWLAHDDLNK